MNAARIIASGLVAFAIVTVLHPWSPAEEKVDSDKRLGRLAKLQEEKLQLLEAGVKHAEASYADGNTSIVGVMKARSRLLKGKLAMAKNPAERVAILKERVEVLKSLETIVLRNHTAGASTVTPATLTNARLKRINAEIALAKEN